jgi:hypothetical protein
MFQPFESTMDVIDIEILNNVFQKLLWNDLTNVFSLSTCARQLEIRFLSLHHHQTCLLKMIIYFSSFCFARVEL